MEEILELPDDIVTYTILEGSVTKKAPPSSRGEVLAGNTYKIKPPDTDHALYVTINVKRVKGKWQPYEIFLNTKDTQHYEFMTALSRVISAIFRQTSEVTFLVEELKAVFSPRGGFFQKGRGYIPGLISAVGGCLESCLEELGEKTYSEKSTDKKLICPKCQQKSMIKQEGCEDRLNCGHTKCG